MERPEDISAQKAVDEEMDHIEAARQKAEAEKAAEAALAAKKPKGVRRDGNRLAYPHRTGFVPVSDRFQTSFRPVPDRCQTSPSSPPCTVPVTVPLVLPHTQCMSCRMHGSVSPQCTVSFRMQSLDRNS